MSNLDPGKKPIADDRDQYTRRTATDGIQVNELAQDDVLSITTANNTYHVTIIDPETAQVRVRGGNYFPSDTLAYVSGSSSDPSFKPYGIYVGCALEFYVNAKRVRTSPVRDILVLRESDRAA